MPNRAAHIAVGAPTGLLFSVYKSHNNNDLATFVEGCRPRRFFPGIGQSATAWSRSRWALRGWRKCFIRGRVNSAGLPITTAWSPSTLPIQWPGFGILLRSSL